jgi:hypothetical protein
MMVDLTFDLLAKKIYSAAGARNTATSDWAKNYWETVIRSLYRRGCAEGLVVRVRN